MNNSQVTQKPKKILLLGLDNSGKTSILLSLKEDINIMSFYALKPTKGVNIEDIEFQNTTISIWDFGGQEQYREEYLRDFNKYAVKANKIIFVIDVQNRARYDLALNYLNDIVNLLEKEDIYIDISIFLHKYDPNLTKKKEFKDIDKIVNFEMIKNIKQIISSKFNYDIFKTTIYTVFEKYLA